MMACAFLRVCSSATLHDSNTGINFDMYTKTDVLNANVFQNEQPNIWFQYRLRFGRAKPNIEGLIYTLHSAQTAVIRNSVNFWSRKPNGRN